MSSRALFVSLTVLFLLNGIIATAGEVKTIDGVVHVQNGDKPQNGLETLHLTETWRLGGADDDTVFGLITQVCSDEDGNIYILDSQLCEVQVYTPDGTYLKTLFRQGEGPGEVTQPVDLALLGDGSVAVAMEFPGRLVRVGRDNTPLDSMEIFDPKTGVLKVLDSVYAGGPTIACSGTQMERPVDGQQTRYNNLSIYDMDGNEIARLTEQINRRSFTDFVLSEKKEMPSFFWANCVGADGRIYTAPDRDRYAIEVYSPQGKLERVVERQYKSFPRSNAEKERLYNALDALMQGAQFEYRIDIEDDEYNIMPLQHGVRVRPDGSLWILPSRGVNDQPEGTMMTFDVFDPDGHFAKQVAIQCPGDGIWDGLFFVGNDQIVVVTGHVEAILAQYGQGVNTYGDEDEESAMTVICYRID